MSSGKTVRLGIIGFGSIGQAHARQILEGKVPRGVLVAACDPVASHFGAFPGVRGFATPEELLAARWVDAVIVATPHFAHTSVGIAALEAGLHVLVEKPLSVHAADAARLLAAHRNPQQIFAAMLNQRTDRFFQALRRLVQGGELGAVRRVHWTVTTWYRTQAYFNLGQWRGTWAGEGGGLLINQALHNLDVFQWIFGRPERVTSRCGFGRYHDIEVEDDVTARFDYPDGQHATFITSTGESPCINRLEVSAELGRVVCENDQLKWIRNEEPMTEFGQRASEPFARPATTESVIPVEGGHGGQHAEIMANFVDAILDGAPLIAPAAEGLASVELANAIILSAWKDQPVTLPLDRGAYELELKARIANSKPKRQPATNLIADWSKARV